MKSIAEALRKMERQLGPNGTVDAHSAGPGHGSEFVVRLPIFEEFSKPSEDSASDQGATVELKRRILVVDDNHDSAMSLGMMLRLMGNEIQTSHDGLAAVEAAEQFRPNMILLDIGLPKLNGYDVCRRIREQEWSNGMVITSWRRQHEAEKRRKYNEHCSYW